MSRRVVLALLISLTLATGALEAGTGEADLVVLRRAVLQPDGSAPAVPSDLAGAPAARLWIVKLDGASLAAWRRQLEGEGVELLSYLPHSAHLVRCDRAVAEQIRSLPFVRWVQPYHPAYRLEASLEAELRGDGSTRHHLVLQAVRTGAAEKGRLAAEVTAAGGRVLRLTPNGALLEAELNGEQTLALLHSDSLQWLERWSAGEDDMDNGRVVSGANYVETMGGYDGSGVRAEVMDSGVDVNHQDFDGLIVHGPAPSVGSHGTATYGIVFGNGDRDGDGDAAATGMLPAAQGHFADYDYLVDRYAHTAELVSSPIEAVFQSNSWGSGRTLHYTAVSSEIDDILWTYDFALFQSQSNSGDQYSRPQAWAKNAISVGGIYHYDDQAPNNDCWCNGASIGPAQDGRIKPELAFWYDAIYTTAPSNGYTPSFGGTSGATPMTAGTGGLVFEMWADNIYGNNPPGGTVFERRPRLATFKAILVNTADQYPFSGLDHDMARARQGWGRPSASRVLDRAGLSGVVDGSSPLEELEFDAYTAPVQAGQGELKVSLAWTDRAANPAAAVHRVNDLDLRVVAPDGTVYRGNHGLLEGPWSLPGGSPDDRNTLENVFIQNPMAGTWRVEVHAREVAMDAHLATPEDDQTYGLVVYGVSSLSECRAAVTPPTGVTATPTAPNQVTVSWSGTAPQYEVWRSEGGCGLPVELVGTTTATTLVDPDVPGGITHGYLVRAVDGCPSHDSPCVEVTASGPCTLPPLFTGLASARGTPATVCGIELGWPEASPRCGGPVVYNVYRSSDPAFTPGPDTRVAACIDSLGHLDQADLEPGGLVHYVVRAEDLSGSGSNACGGSEDANLERRLLTPATLVWSDFETGSDGWELLVPPQSITGEFVAGNPEGTTYGVYPSQPEDAADGSGCLFTGRNPNRNYDRADVDYGEVVALSPEFDATGFADVGLELRRWFYIRDLGEDSADYFKLDVSNDGGTGWINLETLGNTTTGANQWTTVGFPLADLVTPSDRMRIRVRASDGNAQVNLVEAAVDSVRVTGPDICRSSRVFADDFDSGGTGAWSLVVP